jgi:chemotaxis protein histidine kinase CheA
MENFDEILTEFALEAREILDQLDSDFVLLEASPTDKKLIGNIFRGLHTLKGSSGFFSFKRLEKIQLRRLNLTIAMYITKWLWLNQPYLKEEAMWNYANILHQRVEKSGEYKTPYPIYNQIKYFFRNFDPNKTNPNSMKHQHAFFLKKSDLTRADKSLIAKLQMGLSYDQEAIATFESIVIDSLERLHTKFDIYPSKAKITIHTIYEFMLAVYKVGGGDKLCLKRIYKFCNGSEAIKLRLAEVNVGRPFTKEAAMKWEIYEEILRLQPERPISDIIKENDAKSNSRQTFYDLKAKNEALSESLRGNSLN